MLKIENCSERIQLLSQMIDDEMERCRNDVVDAMKFTDAVCGFLNYDTSKDGRRITEEYVYDFIDSLFGDMNLNVIEKYAVAKMVAKKLEDACAQ